MEAFDLAHLVAESRKRDDRYLEFIRKPPISVGLYLLAAGAIDGQSPHTEDEIYYVISGHGFICVEHQDRAVEAGSVGVVGANVEHPFHSITEALSVLVAFPPAAY